MRCCDKINLCLASVGCLESTCIIKQRSLRWLRFISMGIQSYIDIFLYDEEILIVSVAKIIFFSFSKWRTNFFFIPEETVLFETIIRLCNFSNTTALSKKEVDLKTKFPWNCVWRSSVLTIYVARKFFSWIWNLPRHSSLRPQNMVKRNEKT